MRYRMTAARDMVGVFLVQPVQPGVQIALPDRLILGDRAVRSGHDVQLGDADLHAEFDEALTVLASNL